MAKTAQEILEMAEDSEFDAKNYRHKYLRASGWVSRSNHPGGLWLFEKEIDGRWYRCSESTAMYLQKSLSFEAGTD